jgi:hypothetical protein
VSCAGGISKQNVKGTTMDRLYKRLSKRHNNCQKVIERGMFYRKPQYKKNNVHGYNGVGESYMIGCWQGWLQA